MKKVLIVLLGVVVICIIGYAIFYYNTSLTIAVNPSDAQITIDQKEITSGEKSSLQPGTHEITVEKEDYITYRKLVNSTIGSQNIEDIVLRISPVPQKVTDQQAKFATLAKDKNSLYYLSQKTMYTIDDINTEKLNIIAISPDFFENVSDIIWSPNQELAIIKQNNNTSLYNFSRYDLLHQEITPFEDSGIKDTVWSSDSQNIMYYYEPGTGERTLIKATPTNTDKEIIYNFKDTQIRNPQIGWSFDLKDVLIVANNKLYDLNLYTNQMNVISSIEDVVLEAEFMPDNNILMVTKDGVYSLDKTGQNKKKLDFYTDLARITFIDQNSLIISQKEDNRYKFYTYNLTDNTKTELVYNQKYSINPIDNIMTLGSNMIYFESNNYLYRMLVDEGTY